MYSIFWLQRQEHRVLKEQVGRNESMTLTGHWNRIVERTYDLESRNELGWAHQELNERSDDYDGAVRVHLRNGR